MRATPDNDPELRRLMDGFVDAHEASDKAGYLERLPPEQRDKLMRFLVEEMGRELRSKLN